MGGVVGVAIFGTILNACLANNLSGQYYGTAQAGVEAINALPEASKEIVLTGYNDALRIVFISGCPPLAVGMLLAFFITNKRIVRHSNPEPVAMDM